MNKERYTLHTNSILATIGITLAMPISFIATMILFSLIVINIVSNPTTDTMEIVLLVTGLLLTIATTTVILYGLYIMANTYRRANTMYYWLWKMDKENGAAIFDLAAGVILNGKSFCEMVDMYIKDNPNATQEDADNIRRIGNEVADRSEAAAAACKSFNDMAERMANEVGPPDAI